MAETNDIKDLGAPRPSSQQAANQSAPQEVARPQPRGARTYEEARRLLLEAHERLNERTQEHNKEVRRREEVVDGLRRRIRRTSFLVVLLALAIAGVADLLSIIDLGWLIAWVIPLFTILMVRRIDGIKGTLDDIEKSREQLDKEYQALRKRLKPLLDKPEAATLWAQASQIKPPKVRRLKSYMRTFVTETIIVQILEFVPVVNILPMYLAQVVRVLFKQYQAHLQAHRALEGHRDYLQQIARLENFELEYLYKQLQIDYNIFLRFEDELFIQTLEQEERQTAKEAESRQNSGVQDVVFAT